MLKTIEKKIEELLVEIISEQKKKVLGCGRSFIPTLTAEDMLQPMDYSELENNAPFRYEEGVLSGMQTIQAALLALFQDLRED